MNVEPFVLVLAAALLVLVVLVAWNTRRLRRVEKDLRVRLIEPTAQMPRKWNWDELTDRETEVALLVGERKHNAEIAQELSISVRTVERHLENIYGKLGVRNRRELRRALHDRE